jgi:hypothetical protein
MLRTPDIMCKSEQRITCSKLIFIEYLSVAFAMFLVFVSCSLLFCSSLFETSTKLSTVWFGVVPRAQQKTVGGSGSGK